MNSTSRQIFQLRKPPSPLVLEPLRAVVQTANSLGFAYFLTGATARDLILENIFGRPPGRLTRDLDFGFALSDWKQFESLKAALIATGRFQASRAIHRVSYLYSPDIKVNVDLIPFGGIQDGSKIFWPPQNDFAMNVTGFSDALESSIHVQIDTALVIPVVSLPGLIILKLFACLDRKHERRDAPDILKIVSENADAGNEERLYTDEIQFLEAADFDVTAAGARLLGKDARRISSAETAASLMNVLADARLKQELVNQMIQSGNRTDEFFADHCTLLLDNFERGFTKTMPQQPAGH
jgi:predicted nucleotidyltransferase